MKLTGVRWWAMVFGLLFLNLREGISQQEDLRAKVSEIVQSIKGNTGVALLGLTGRDSLTWSGNNKFPMQSVYKFPLAMAVLDQVDKGEFQLTQKIHITKKDLRDTYSPLRDKYPVGNVDITLSDLLAYTVSNSDNNGCDILFRLMGGPAKVEAYVRGLGVKDISIVATEEEMARDWKVQYTNWSTPSAMAQLLEIFFNGKALSKASNDLLWKMMVESTTGKEKIKGQLPDGTTVAHKSGASGANDKGLIGAANDVGIVALPSGSYLIIVVFISDTTDTEEKCATAIARISKASWDYFSLKK
jgi:beta-lactamase class A